MTLASNLYCKALHRSSPLTVHQLRTTSSYYVATKGLERSCDGQTPLRVSWEVQWGHDKLISLVLWVFYVYNDYYHIYVAEFMRSCYRI